MAEDRFANVFTAQVVQTAANTLTWAQMNFGINLRDRIGMVIDEIFFYITHTQLALMTATGDHIQMSLATSDNITSLDPSDRRILYQHQLVRLDGGTAANLWMEQFPIKVSFAPPMIVLPNRLYLGVLSAGLASSITLTMRLHFRTVPISQDQQLIEILETFQLST